MSKLLSKEALKIIKICKDNSIFFSVYTTEGIITEGLKFVGNGIRLL